MPDHAVVQRPTLVNSFICRIVLAIPSCLRGECVNVDGGTHVRIDYNQFSNGNYTKSRN